MGSKKAKNKTKSFCKYTYYESTVQCVENDIDFINDQFKALRKRKPHTLREDFGGTAKLACEWVKQGSKYSARALDLDPEPIEYGKENHYSELSKGEKSRVSYELKNVMSPGKDKSDVIVAFNFSYFIFKKREELVKYFKQVRKTLKSDGVFFLDLFGGPESMQLLEEETEYDDYSYFWDCDKFNPITNECLFKIHFKPKGEKKKKDVFVYDWRMWGLAELREILIDAGFSKTVAFWEEDDEDTDGGNGEFYIAEEAENCDAWVTYIAALV
jgi:SAM-dependent methyltransferase